MGAGFSISRTLRHKLLLLSPCFLWPYHCFSPCSNFEQQISAPLCLTVICGCGIPFSFNQKCQEIIFPGSSVQPITDRKMNSPSSSIIWWNNFEILALKWCPLFPSSGTQGNASRTGCLPFPSLLSYCFTNISWDNFLIKLLPWILSQDPLLLKLKPIQTLCILFNFHSLPMSLEYECPAKTICVWFHHSNFIIQIQNDL